jgi:ankyrin repeat protein
MPNRLTQLGSTASTDEEFLQAERQISSQEFLAAVLEDRREDVAKMIVHDERLVHSRDGSGATAVLLATYHGLDDMLGVLLRAGTRLDLFEAAAVGDSERVREALADTPSLVAETSGDGFPPLQLACFFGRAETAQAILDVLSSRADGSEILNRPARNPTLVRAVHSAAACRDAEASLTMMRELLDAGADFEAEQAGGFRPLHAAASSGRGELVELLLARGADAGAETDLGRTAADFAAEKGHSELADRLRAVAH